MSDIDREMLNELIVESREHLEKIEPDLLELEQNGNNVSDELVNRVFRAVHSIKGGFGFFGISKIVDLAHSMENVMSRVRDKDLKVTGDLTDALLEGIDKLRTLLDDVGNSENVSIEEEQQKLKPFLSGNIAKEEDDLIVDEIKSADSDMSIDDFKSRFPKLTDEVISETIKNGKLLYLITLHPEKDLIGKDIIEILSTWEKFGEVLQSLPSRSELNSVDDITNINEISILYITVLESDLISDGLEIDPESAYNINLSFIKQNVEQGIIAENNGNEIALNKQSEGKRSESRIEEALRVKVSLLNNLMNNAGELVLARNQLIQFVGRSFNEFQEAQKTVKLIMDSVTKTLDTMKDGVLTGEQEKELKELEKNILASLNFRLSDIQGINNIVQNVDMVTTVLQEGIMQTRMQPISVVFSKFPRVIRDLAKKLGKKINLTQIGQEVELDKSIIELLSDPLTHLIRNCADHGIESIDDRRKANKDDTGQVVLRAYQEGGKVIIEIDDDGSGIDPDKVKSKAIEKGIITKEQAEVMSKREAQMLIFSPGFSTAQTVSDVSGRGVGMDVVKTNIERLGGTIELDSTIGDGTRVTMKLPLTLAIIPSLIVMSEGRRFAVPQVGLEEVVRIRAKDITSKIERIHNAEVLRLRGKLLPLVRLANTLGLAPTYVHPETGERLEDKRERFSDRRGAPEEQSSNVPEDIQDKRTGDQDRRNSIKNAVKILVLKIEKSLFGLIVDDVLDSEEIVVKPLPEYLKASQCYAGSTIMGDGRVAMILDPSGVAEMASLRLDTLDEDLKEEEAKRDKARANLEDVLLFTIGGQEHLAIGLDEIARIEKRSVDEIEVVGNKEFLKNEDNAIRIVHLDHYMPVTASQADDSNSMFIIVPKGTENPLGFIAKKVEDTVSTELSLDKEAVKGIGVKGSQIINNNLTLLIDVPALIDAASD